MFRSKATQEEVHYAESESFDEGTIKSDIGTFSFFGFNFFEVDETLQNDDDESVTEEAPVEDIATKTEGFNDSSVDSKGKPKRVFWLSQTNTRNVDRDGPMDGGDTSMGMGVITKIKGNLSRTIGNIKHVELNLAERKRSTSKRTGKIFDRTLSKDVDKYETRDDLEQNHGTTYIDSFESTSRDVYDDMRSSDKKCFPSWPLKKNSATERYIEPMQTIQETESIHPLNARSATKPNKSNEYDGYYTSSHRHRSSSGTVRTSASRHTSKPYNAQRSHVHHNTTKPQQLRTNGTYIKPSNYDDNIWDDESTSSGWFSLESLDAR